MNQNSYQEFEPLRKAQLSTRTYLIVDLIRSALERHILCEDIALLDQLLTLRPVVECAGDIDLLGRVRPESNHC